MTTSPFGKTTRFELTGAGAKELDRLRDEGMRAGGVGKLSKGKRWLFHILRLSSRGSGGEISVMRSFLGRRMKMKRSSVDSAVHATVRQGRLRVREYGASKQ